ncbi:hypothetical protein KKP04_13630 [Rhodomicrobium sp. Az07]|uniref:hypothetical protein n=1 Tax=Rhodomicrobium sp. Az07 TaxID=2839034 RepID=UPI001BE88D75|nr:hypothetical protein [Rhodomicrobium sp. Az07]MBT3071904.1 hypothetical protein [Rhodomicrobium sp. Az07]
MSNVRYSDVENPKFDGPKADDDIKPAPGVTVEDMEQIRLRYFERKLGREGAARFLAKPDEKPKAE